MIPLPPGDADCGQGHPWVTKDGKDPLLSTEENTANMIEPPTQEETDQAITGNMSNILVIVRHPKVHLRTHLMSIQDESCQEI